MNESRDKQSALDVSRVKIHPLIGIARQGLTEWYATWSQAPLLSGGELSGRAEKHPVAPYRGQWCRKQDTEHTLPSITCSYPTHWQRFASRDVPQTHCTWGTSTYPLPVKPSRVACREALKRVEYLPCFSELFMHLQEGRHRGRTWLCVTSRAQMPVIHLLF